jgi:hypothetical protein
VHLYVHVCVCVWKWNWDEIKVLSFFWYDKFLNSHLRDIDKKPVFASSFPSPLHLSSGLGMAQERR